MGRMFLADALGVAGSLSCVSKGGGQWASWGIPASMCPRGVELQQCDGTACKVCYANMRGNYRHPNVINAQLRRLEAIENPLWVDAMVALVEVWEYFRWFDSGDVQNLAHLDKIFAIARRCRRTKFWLPTHEPYLIGERLDDIPRNMTVRISADFIEDRPTTPTWGLPTSTIHCWPGEPVPAADGNRKHSVECKAHLRGGCGRCRICWEEVVPNVSYLVHTKHLGARKAWEAWKAQRQERIAA
jgi:hypothetical protein